MINDMVVVGRLIGYDENANLLLRECTITVQDCPDA